VDDSKANHLTKQQQKQFRTGTGKTFVALNSMLAYLENSTGNVLYICRNAALAFHFVKWLCYRFRSSGAGEIERVLKKLFFLCNNAEGDNNIRSVEYDSTDHILKAFVVDECEGFGKIVIDEAHFIFCTAKKGTGLQAKVKSVLDAQENYDLMVLSDESQADFSQQSIEYPKGVAVVELTEVCRISQRLLAGALAYQLDSVIKNNIGCAHDSIGPALRAFFLIAKLVRARCKSMPI
jgi:hypothetical protein